MTATNSTTPTIASALAALVGGDGTVWTTSDGRDFAGLLDEECSWKEHQGDPSMSSVVTRYDFLDGSSIVTNPEFWDFGFPGCFCSSGVGHSDECVSPPAAGKIAKERTYLVTEDGGDDSWEVRTSSLSAALIEAEKGIRLGHEDFELPEGEECHVSFTVESLDDDDLPYDDVERGTVLGTWVGDSDGMARPSAQG